MNISQTEPLLLSDDAHAGDYIALMKPRVMSLVIFTALVGMLMAPQTIPAMHPVLMLVALILIAAGAGASAVLNMWYEADIDAKMERTAARPIPSGRVLRGEALTLGICLAAFSVVSLGVLINYLSGALLLFTIVFYAWFYTMVLKRRTPQNIVIGGAAGALPPVIGWAAATNTLALEPFIFFLIIFLWTPPHFWALALIKNEDYKRVNIPMLPVVAGIKTTLWNILAYSLLLVGASALPYVLGFSGLLYMQVAMIMGAGFLTLAITTLLVRQKNKWAGGLFAYSIFYLFVIFSALLLDRGLA
ncbi:MAG: protoheme IX farnesyltransferase [Alphaproteobacteria bacterium]|nr:protoheme IX farnesyltransferase [Alphaproteobacteria bacterium]MBE8220558.1 protoheme IX farnesyltransferase [Alphaproteobacteria bacterium]